LISAISSFKMIGGMMPFTPEKALTEEEGKKVVTAGGLQLQNALKELNERKKQEHETRTDKKLNTFLENMATTIVTAQTKTPAATTPAPTQHQQTQMAPQIVPQHQYPPGANQYYPMPQMVMAPQHHPQHYPMYPPSVYPAFPPGFCQNTQQQMARQQTQPQPQVIYVQAPPGAGAGQQHPPPPPPPPAPQVIYVHQPPNGHGAGAAGQGAPNNAGAQGNAAAHNNAAHNNANNAGNNIQGVFPNNNNANKFAQAGIAPASHPGLLDPMPMDAVMKILDAGIVQQHGLVLLPQQGMNFSQVHSQIQSMGVTDVKNLWRSLGPRDQEEGCRFMQVRHQLDKPRLTTLDEMCDAILDCIAHHA
jgi:hypothetical protein